MADITFKKRVLFIGIPDMAFATLALLHNKGVNIVAVMGPKKNNPTYAQFRNYVDTLKLNFIDYESLKSPELLDTIRNLNIDIGVVASFNAKIPEEFTNCIKDGILNQHPSLLPDYRGGNPYSGVIINDEKETGVTIHYIAKDFDTGDIVYQAKCPIAPNETMGTIFEKTNRQSSLALLEVLKLYEADKEIVRKPQPQGKFKLAPNIKTNETFIDYKKSATEIERYVRALNPFITALTVFRNQYLKIHKVSVSNEEISDEFSVGDIYKIENDKVFVKTSDGGITIDVIQMGSLFIGDSKNFIDIIKPRVGEHFGN